MVVYDYRSLTPGQWVEKELALFNVHRRSQCAGDPCVLHEPSDHHMLWWEPVFDQSTGLISRFCPEHHVAHPDPDSWAWVSKVAGHRIGRHVCKCVCCKKF